jgi:2,5-dioxopentanoate dehydrogenase
MQQILINGDWTFSSSSADGFRALNPSTGETRAPIFPFSNWKDLDSMAEAAMAAAVHPANAEPDRIGHFLELFADRLDANRAKIAETAHEETALPLETRLAQIEFGRMLGQLRAAASAARDVSPNSWRTPLIDTDSGIRSDFGPLGGAVLTIGPNNFPLAFHAVSGGDFAAAIAAGNPVIAKGHPLHPETGLLLARCAAEAVTEAGLHPATVQYFHQCDPEDGLRLVVDSRIAAVGFTGSRAAGLSIKAAADASGTPSFLEMSSVNPVFVLPSALAERGAQIGGEWAASLLMGAGQFCTKPGIAVMVGKGGDAFLEAATSALRAAAPGVLFSVDGVERLACGIDAVEAAGAVLRCGGASGSPGSRFEPTLLEVDGDDFLKSFEDLSQELFGPVGLVVRAADLNEASSLAARFGGQLTATMFTGSDDDAAWMALGPILRVKCGRLIENKMPTGVAVVPSMVHGGPYPATGHPGFTAVGLPTSVRRFAMARCWDGVASERLPAWLQ